MHSKKLKITDFGEKKLIDRIIKKTRQSQMNYFSSSDFQIKKSLGDDAALIDFGSKYLVASSDMLLEKSHFPPQMKPEEMGWKIVTVNVSDLAAMGAHPRGFLVSMGLPRDMDVEFFDKLIDGILEACEHYDIPLIGGDTNESPQLVLDGTALGEVDKKNVMMKSKTAQGPAEPGDLIAVTGGLGLAAAGFEFLLSEIYPELLDKSNFSINSSNIQKTKNLIKKHALRPRARLNEGIIAAESGMFKGATDITDGLASELEEILKSSKNNFDGNSNNSNSLESSPLNSIPLKSIGIKIHEDQMPIPSEVKEIAEIFDKDPLGMALYYGEDFELLLIIKRESLEEIKKILDIYLIGEITDSGVIEIVKNDGSTIILPSGGYQHLK